MFYPSTEQSPLYDQVQWLASQLQVKKLRFHGKRYITSKKRLSTYFHISSGVIPVVSRLQALPLPPMRHHLTWFRREDPHMGVSVFRRQLSSTLISSMSSQSEEMARSCFLVPGIFYVLLDVNFTEKHTTQGRSVTGVSTCRFDTGQSSDTGQRKQPMKSSPSNNPAARGLNNQSNELQYSIQ